MPVEDAAAVTAQPRQPHRMVELPILLVNVHENCNCRCVMCDIWKRDSGDGIDIEALGRHRASLRSLKVKQVVLTGGEALMHSRFSELCTFFRECGVETVTLLTTGLLLKKRADIVAQGIDEIIVSIDGPPEVHDSVRRVKQGFSLIGEGIKAVRQLKPEMPVLARTTVQRANHNRLCDTVAAVKSMGMDSISFLPVDVSSQAFNRELIWPGERQSEVALTRSEVGVLEDEIERLIREHSDDISRRYIVESAEKLRRLPRRFYEQLGDMPPQAPMCNAPWVSAVLEVNGDVRPCFFHRTVGNAQSVDLEDVLNGDDAVEFRRSLRVAENPICQRCVCSLHYR